MKLDVNDRTFYSSGNTKKSAKTAAATEAWNVIRIGTMQYVIKVQKLWPSIKSQQKNVILFLPKYKLLRPSITNPQKCLLEDKCALMKIYGVLSDGRKIIAPLSVQTIHYLTQYSSLKTPNKQL